MGRARPDCVTVADSGYAGAGRWGFSSEVRLGGDIVLGCKAEKAKEGDSKYTMMILMIHTVMQYVLGEARARGLTFTLTMILLSEGSAARRNEAKRTGNNRLIKLIISYHLILVLVLVSSNQHRPKMVYSIQLNLTSLLSDNQRPSPP